MRKLTKYLIVIISVVGISSSAFAAFQSIWISTITAGVTFGAGGVLEASIELRSLADGTTVAEIGWDVASISPGVTNWYPANAYIVLHSTLTDTSGGVVPGIQIYTDNGNISNVVPDANPAYTGATNTNPAGLVAEGVGYTDDPPLPMCWRVVDVSTDTYTIAQGASGFPDRLYNPTLGDSYPCFLWMKDKHTPTIGGTTTTVFVDGEDYVTIKETGRGLQHAEATWVNGASPSPDYIYIGAKFTNAYYSRTYKTSTLRVEMFTE